MIKNKIGRGIGIYVAKNEVICPCPIHCAYPQLSLVFDGHLVRVWSWSIFVCDNYDSSPLRFTDKNCREIETKLDAKTMGRCDDGG